MPPYKISRVFPKDLLFVWPHLQASIQRGMRRGIGDTLSERELFDAVWNESVHLWIAHCGEEILAGVFLSVEQRERGKALIVMDAVAGSGHGFTDYAKEMLPRLREYAEMIGAYTIEGWCRLGTARLLSRLGCKPKAIVMELGDGRRRT